MSFVAPSSYKRLVHIEKIRIACLKVDIGPKNLTFIAFICRTTTLDCSKNVYVFYLCSLSMYSIYVVHLCSPSMQSIYVVHLCILSMQSIYVFYLCILSMQSIYVCILSMKTRLQNQNFTIFKIALNRVLTLPADRARCTDHFAGSGSKIENKNISVVAKH